MHEASEDTVRRLEHEDALVNGEASVGQPSIMEALRKQRAELESQQTIVLDIPGYRGMLQARYHLLAGDELQKIGKRVRGQFRHLREQQNEVVFAVAADTLISACGGFLYRNEDGELHDIMVNGAPLTYSSADDLTEFLGLPPAGSAREAVLAVFGGPTRDIAVIEHYTRLFKWMRNTSVDVTADMLGEF